MNDRDQRRYDRATRVQTFGAENSADFTEGSQAKIHFNNLGSLIQRVEAAKAGQNPSRVSTTTLFDSLGIDLQNIARTARRIEVTENGFAAVYRLPDHATDSALTTHTDAILKRLEDQPGDSAATKKAKAALRARFIAYELPNDFVAQLRADRQAIAEANRRNQAGSQGGVESTELIGALLGKINNEIADLNAIMHNKYTRQPEKLRAWHSASHVERPPHHQKPAQPPQQPPPAG